MTSDPIAEILAAKDRLSVFDVSPVIDSQLPVFFLHPAPAVTPATTHEKEGVAVNMLSLSEHTGTHVDAPFHFAADGQTIDQIAVDALMLRPYCKYDLTGGDYQPGDLIGVADLEAAAEAGGFSPGPGDIAIIEVGWDRNLPGGDAGRDDGWWGRNQPGLSPEACDHLASLGVSAVACDTAACDIALADGEIKGAHGHTQAFLPAGILIVEGLTGLAAAPATGLFLALPLRIAGGTGSPLRIMLLAEDK
jgi:arylformamidase